MRKLTLWLWGLYRDVFEKEYGGAVRSRGLYTIMEKLFGEKLGDVLIVSYSRSKSKLEVGNNSFNIKFSIKSKIKYSLVEALVRLNVISKRSALRVLSLEPSEGSIRALGKLAEAYDRVNVIVDGLPGIVLFNKLKDKIKYNNIIYISHNFEVDYRVGNRGKIAKLESRMVGESDLTIASSPRDALRYKDLVSIDDRLVVFPNVFPVEFRMQPKREKLLVAIVAGSSDAWASKIACFLSRKGVDVLYVGGRDPGCNVIMAGKIPGRANFLSTISTAHAGINYDIHLGGSNVKKYDYALAGLAIFSGGTGVRGDFLPGEAAFADEYDLLAKLSGYTVEELEYMGRRNRDHAIREFEEALRRLQERVEQLL